MRITRIHIETFRNFKSLDVTVGPHAVIVGENKVGKSNLLFALRLILDPSLPDSARQLTLEDFWDGLKRPLGSEDRILISIDLGVFEDNVDHVALLAEHLIESEPMVARLSYVFQLLTTIEGERSRESDYEFLIFGGNRPANRVSSEVRRRLPLDLLPALRDAESDLANWRRSPLRPLLDAVAGDMDPATLDTLAAGVTKATQVIAETDEIRELGTRLTDTLVAIVGRQQAVDATLGFSPTDAQRLIRSLRLFVDDAQRSISEASLGSTNLIYLALKSLELEYQVAAGTRSHTFLAIEEPEAHLHPQVQRRVFRSFLRPRSHTPIVEGHAQQSIGTQRTLILTTHSPYIVSVAPLRSLIMLRSKNDPKETIGISTARLDLTDAEVDDLERYIDVTRGEMLFARGVILVEGDAETYLVPVFAKLLGHDLDELGITVCSVGGTHVVPYLKLLGKNGLAIPFAVITDEDPKTTADGCFASNRVRAILEELTDEELPDDDGVLFTLAADYGVFVTKHTLEIAVFKSGRHKSMTKTLRELTTNAVACKRARDWSDNPDSLDPAQLLKDIEAIGKGRFAQRLATHINKMKSTLCPLSIADAVKHVVEAVR